MVRASPFGLRRFQQLAGFLGQEQRQFIGATLDAVGELQHDGRTQARRMGPVAVFEGAAGGTDGGLGGTDVGVGELAEHHAGGGVDAFGDGPAGDRCPLAADPGLRDRGHVCCLSDEAARRQ
jgi:hypothetical protein